MLAAQGRSAYLLCLSSALAVFVSGCAVGGKSFSMDSNSRVPFFGLELKERKPKSSAPSYDSISRSKGDKARIETAVSVGPKASKGLLKKSDKLLLSGGVSEANEFAPKQESARVKVTDTPPPQSIPLPMIDTSHRPPARQSAAVVIDFQ